MPENRKNYGLYKSRGLQYIWSRSFFELGGVMKMGEMCIPDEIWLKLFEIFKSIDAALSWYDRKIPALGKTPKEAVENGEIEEVLDVLARLKQSLS